MVSAWELVNLSKEFLDSYLYDDWEPPYHEIRQELIEMIERANKEGIKEDLLP